MREIIISRPKRFECAAVALHVSVNGRKLAKIKNGQRIIMNCDEGSQEIHVGGGMFNKKFQDTIKLPAGHFSYEFRVDFPSTGSSYEPVLRPSKGDFVKDDSRLVILMGAELARLLLDEQFRAGLKALSNARIHLMVVATEWRIVLFHDHGSSIVYRAGYAKANEGLAGALVSALEHGDLSTREGCEKITNKVLDDYAACLPDYERIGKRGLVFKGQSKIVGMNRSNQENSP